MNGWQQRYVDYFLERVESWRGLNRDATVAMMLAARDADHAHPLRSEEAMRKAPRASTTSAGLNRRARPMRAALTTDEIEVLGRWRRSQGRARVCR